MPRSHATNTVEILGMPVSLDAERFVIGSALLDDAMLPDLQSCLTPDDFSTEAHRTVVARMNIMAQRGEKVDRITVINDLIRSGDLEKCGGISYLASLDDGLPRLPNIDSYLKIVREKSILRQTIRACDGLMRECLSQSDSSEALLSRGERILSELQGKLAEDAEFRTPEEIVSDAGGVDAYFRSRRVPGLVCDWEKLNGATRGFQPGHLIVLAGRTSMGKSAVAANIAVQVARRGAGVAFFSLEMDRVEVNDRLMALSGGCRFSDLRGTDRQLVSHAVRTNGALPIYIRDMTGCTAAAIHAKVRKLRNSKGIGLVIVDYLQLLSPAGRFENRNQEVSAMTRALKIAAGDLRIPFLVLSQLSRSEKTAPNRRPHLSDLRESGSIEQDANMVIFIHSERAYEEYQPGEPADATLIVAKQRNGPKIDIPMRFWPDRGLFTEAV